jgi:hypothetical protein
MELNLKSGIKILKKNHINLTFDFLDEIDIITIKNLNSFSKEYFKSKLERLRIYRYILNYGKTCNDIRNKKIRILNLMTNSDFIHRARNLFKVDEYVIIEICYKLADQYNNMEMKILENLK